MRPGQAIVWIWVVWAALWLLAALWSAQTSKRLPAGAERTYWLVQIAGAIMLSWSGQRVRPYDPDLWDVGQNGGWALAGVVAAGLLFACWARLELGRLWSGNVARKAEHRIIDSGPYALTRHPIYTGILLSLFATGIVIGQPLAISGVAIITIGFYVKARLEEQFLRTELGAAAYDEYARRTPMLVPFLR